MATVATTTVPFTPRVPQSRRGDGRTAMDGKAFSEVDVCFRLSSRILES